jgi:hypothetical protein
MAIGIMDGKDRFGPREVWLLLLLLMVLRQGWWGYVGMARRKYGGILRFDGPMEVWSVFHSDV